MNLDAVVTEIEEIIIQCKSSTNKSEIEKLQKKYKNGRFERAKNGLCFDSYRKSAERHIEAALSIFLDGKTDLKLFKCADSEYQINELDYRFLNYILTTYDGRDAINLRKGNFEEVSLTYLDYFKFGIENLSLHKTIDIDYKKVQEKYLFWKCLIMKKAIIEQQKFISDIIQEFEDMDLENEVRLDMYAKIEKLLADCTKHIVAAKKSIPTDPQIINFMKANFGTEWLDTLEKIK